MGDIDIERPSRRSWTVWPALGLCLVLTACSSSEPPGAAGIDDLEDELQGALDEMRLAAGAAGMTAVVARGDEQWSGASGTADGRRPVTPEDQFNIGSINKTVIAAEVMRLVEDRELALDDAVADLLPVGLAFDVNGATVRQLLTHRSGIPDYWTPEFQQTITDDPRRVWTTEELLDSVSDVRIDPDVTFQYSSTNYVLLGLVVEQVRGRPLVEVLRSGVLDVPGTDRLVSQPEERPSAPMAVPDGAPAATVERNGGYLPSRASATSNGPGAVLVSDAPSLARWWQALCSGEVVSEESFDAMARMDGDYGLGLMTPYPGVVAHTGEDVGFSAWAGCEPETGTVVVVLANRIVDDIRGVAGPVLDLVAPTGDGSPAP